MLPEDDLDEATDITFELEETEAEGQETDSESSTDTEEAQEKSTKPVFDEGQQKAFDKAIGKKVYQITEKDREIQGLNARIKSLEDSLPKEQRPVIPPTPDPYQLSDQEFRRKAGERDEAIARQAAYDSQQQVLQQQQLLDQKQKQEQYVAEQNEKINSYSKRANALGITADELQVAGNTVAGFGVSQDLVDHILGDEMGPAITMYLSKNAVELDNIRNMSPMQAAVRIENQIRGEAAKLKPKVSAAPPPVEKPQAAGSAPKAKGPDGATFE
tara:strand:+ start:9100 stop:9915 length:816 start_codon:yes stop_codon:yes gene_type:complete